VNDQIINELYQLAGREVPREKIEQAFSLFSPDEAQEWVEFVQQRATDNPESVKHDVWSIFVQERFLKKGYPLLHDEEGYPLLSKAQRIEEALAIFSKSLPYLEHAHPHMRIQCYTGLIRAYTDKYEFTWNFPGKGESIEEQGEFVEVWNAFQKFEESWAEYEGASEERRKDYEFVMGLKPHYLCEALVRIEGYTEPLEIIEMRNHDPEAALEEWKKWFPYQNVFEPPREYILCLEFVAACAQVYGEPSNYPGEDFDYAWGAVQSLRRIWDNHQQEIIDTLTLPMSPSEYSQQLEQSYQQFASEHTRRAEGASPQPGTQTPKKGGGCFIATAVYGSENAPAVLVLRSFRDDILLSSKLGRVFVNLYYLISPPVARLLSNNSPLQNIARKAVVRPIANLVRSKLYPN